VFGALAALLVAIGIYGLLAYTVARRINEFGIRMALGATARDLARMVLTSALGLVGAGLVIGAPIALWSKGVAASVLSTIAATSAEQPTALPVAAAVPIALAAVAMIAVALVAAYVPARRATRVDPIVALRCE
jgi:putative ABC transport system permease protein